MAMRRSSSFLMTPAWSIPRNLIFNAALHTLPVTPILVTARLDHGGEIVACEILGGGATFTSCMHHKPQDHVISE